MYYRIAQLNVTNSNLEKKLSESEHSLKSALSTNKVRTQYILYNQAFSNKAQWQMYRHVVFRILGVCMCV